MNKFLIKKTALVLLILIASAGLASCGSDDKHSSDATQNNSQQTAQAVDYSKLPVIEAKLTHAPEVPPPVDRDYPAKVIVKMETKEVTLALSDGVEYNFWTFGGRVPGQMIRIRQGDLVEFYLSNHPDSKMPHNIDLHAVTGTGGGAASSFTAPGHTSTFSFKALNPGLYIYHCATAPVGMHVANGMYGLILVEPEEGLPKVDKEFYVVQSDFYTKGEYGDQGFQPFSMEKAIKEKPDYVVFNGSVGALLGDNALKAKAGETVRMYVGNGGPNLVSSFHVIGEIFDKVYMEGGSAINENVQTTLIPAGGAAMVEFKVDVPGTYTFVDHSIFRAFNKGALGQIVVDGDEDKVIYSGKQDDAVYLSEGGSIQSIPDEKKESTESQKAKSAKSKEEKIALGKAIYEHNCLACHQSTGQGVVGVFPPLAKSDYFNEDPTRGIVAITKGLSGKVKVNGKEFNSVMPPLSLNNEDISNVLTYVLNSFGNKGGEVTVEQLDKVRKQ